MNDNQQQAIIEKGVEVAKKIMPVTESACTFAVNSIREKDKLDEQKIHVIYREIMFLFYHVACRYGNTFFETEVEQALFREVVYESIVSLYTGIPMNSSDNNDRKKQLHKLCMLLMERYQNRILNKDPQEGLNGDLFWEYAKELSNDLYGQSELSFVVALKAELTRGLMKLDITSTIQG